MQKTEDVDGPSLSIAGFCEAEDFSLSYYYGHLKKFGLNPQETRYPGSPLVRISARARAEWHEKMAALQNSEAVLLEEQRRRELAKHAGKIAALSARHVSRRARSAPAKRRRAGAAR